MKALRLILAIVLMFVAAPQVWAQKVHVKGYVKKDGTYVAPHERKAPKSQGGTTASSTGSTKSGSDHTPASTTSRPATSSNSSHKSTSTTMIQRSEAARAEFMRRTGYAHGRPGYVVDHVIPLACGGADAPSNMQWQTVGAAKAKDKWERDGCGRK